MIENLEGFPGNTVAFACHGHVTREDYLNTVVPAVNRAFEENERVRLYYEVGSDLEAIDMAAAWTDFATGVEHWLRWERIAVVTDVAWIGTSIQAFGFLMPGEIKLFSLKDRAVAKEWVSES
jgi:hypothetical protein